MDRFEEDPWFKAGARAVEEKDPPPEKYSLEWYALEGEKNAKMRASAPPDRDAQPALLLGVALIASTFGLLAARAGG